MSYLFDNFSLFIYRNKEKSQDICKLYNAFVKTLKQEEQEFAYNEFPLFIMVGQSCLDAPEELWPYLLGRKK